MASLTKRDLVAALEELLPPMDPNEVTVKSVMADIALHLGVNQDELKAHHRKELKQIMVDMIHLCQGGQDKENELQSNEEDAEEEDVDEEIEAKKRPSKRSRGRIQESDDEDGDDQDGSDDDNASGDSDDEERQPKRQKKISPASKKKKAVPTKRKTPVARKTTDKPMDSEGLAALKELARVAGLMSPAVYATLKKCASEEEQEVALRERIQGAGIRFSSPYPKKSDIMAAKRKREKDKEMDGIDTSLIITEGRSRRGSAPQETSYVTKYDDEDEDEENGDGNMDEDEGMHDQDEEESEAEVHEASEASDESEAEF